MKIPQTKSARQLNTMKHLIILISIFLWGISACGSDRIKIAVLAFNSKEKTLAEWQPTANYLNKKLPGYEFEMIPMDYPQIRDAALKGSVDFIITNSGHYVYLETNYHISRIATMVRYKNHHWIDSFGGVIFTRNTENSPKNLKELRGKKIAAVDTDSLGGYAAPLFELHKIGLNQEDVKFVFTGMPHEKVVNDVISGKSLAGFVRTEVLEELAQEGKIDLASIRVLNPQNLENFSYKISTNLYPEWPLARMPKTSLDLANKVLLALLQKNDVENPQQGDIGWTAPLEYSNIHEVFQALRLPPYDHPEQFTLYDIYKRYELFINIIGVLSLIIIIGVVNEFRLRRRLEYILAEQIESMAQIRLAALVYENSSDAIAILDSEGERIISINPEFESLNGYTLQEIDNRQCVFSRKDGEFYEKIWLGVINDGFWEGQISNQNKNGDLYTKWLAIRAVYDLNDTPYRYIAILSDITEQKVANQQLWHEANFDRLTNLPNKSMFVRRLDAALKDVKLNKHYIALLYIDLDNFKEINESMGHTKGDMLLQEAANRIKKCLLKIDLLARFGGDEFTIILSHLETFEMIEKTAATILSELSHVFSIDNQFVYVSASIGITIAPKDGASSTELMINADQAMYEAKKNGRNCYRFFEPYMQEIIQQRVKVIAALREAIELKQFTMYYQPIISCDNEHPHKAEALIRWTKSDGSMVSPAEFIPIAEDTKLIIPIGKWIFEQTIAQVKEWREKYDPIFQVSINKSPVQFCNEDKSVLLELLAYHNLSSDAIVIEITEGLLMEQTLIIENKLLNYKKEGVSVSLDDFGTGYSSMSYLKKFDIDYLKIDQSFVRNVISNTNDQILCEAMVAMAHKMNIKVIAEGVETIEHKNYLESIGCDYLQGYYFSKPVSALEFEKRYFG